MRRNVQLGPAQEIVRWVAREGRERITEQYLSGDAGESRAEPAYTTGEWLTGLRAFVTPGGLAVTFRNDSPQAQWTEMGRNPGRVPIGRIYEWVLDKWGLDAEDAYPLARHIAASIEVNGYPAHRIMEQAIDEDFKLDYEAVIQDEMDSFLTEMGFRKES